MKLNHFSCVRIFVHVRHMTGRWKAERMQLFQTGNTLGRDVQQLRMPVEFLPSLFVQDVAGWETVENLCLINPRTDYSRLIQTKGSVLSIRPLTRYLIWLVCQEIFGIHSIVVLIPRKEDYEKASRWKINSSFCIFEYLWSYIVLRTKLSTCEDYIM